LASIEAIINRQLLKWELVRKQAEEKPSEEHRPPPIVTISRQTGSRGAYFASRLSQRLGYQLLHREVIDAICASSGYRKRIVEALDYRVQSDLKMMVESVLTGQSVDHSDYVKHLYRVILTMSRLGGVIVLGRGCNFILGPKRGAHFRVIAPKERRIENLMKYKGSSREDAVRTIEKSDAERKEFVAKVYRHDIDDPFYYDVVMNSALIDVEEMVDTAALAVQAKMDKLTHLDNDPV
jgi:cytidylate kinase